MQDTGRVMIYKYSKIKKKVRKKNGMGDVTILSNTLPSYCHFLSPLFCNSFW